MRETLCGFTLAVEQGLLRAVCLEGSEELLQGLLEFTAAAGGEELIPVEERPGHHRENRCEPEECQHEGDGGEDLGCACEQDHEEKHLLHAREDTHRHIDASLGLLHADENTQHAEDRDRDRYPEVRCPPQTDRVDQIQQVNHGSFLTGPNGWSF